MAYAIIALVVAVLSSIVTVALFMKAPGTAMKVGAWIRLSHNLLVLMVASFLILGSLFVMIRGLGDGMGGGFYVALGGLGLTMLLLDRGTAHLRDWASAFGANDLPSRIGRLFKETGRLWRDLVMRRNREDWKDV